MRFHIGEWATYPSQTCSACIDLTHFHSHSATAININHIFGRPYISTVVNSHVISQLFLFFEIYVAESEMKSENSY